MGVSISAIALAKAAAGGDKSQVQIYTWQAGSGRARWPSAGGASSPQILLPWREAGLHF